MVFVGNSDEDRSMALKSAYTTKRYDRSDRAVAVQSEPRVVRPHVSFRFRTRTLGATSVSGSRGGDEVKRGVPASGFHMTPERRRRVFRSRPRQTAVRPVAGARVSSSCRKNKRESSPFSKRRLDVPTRSRVETVCRLSSE